MATRQHKTCRGMNKWLRSRQSKYGGSQSNMQRTELGVSGFWADRPLRKKQSVVACAFAAIAAFGLSGCSIPSLSTGFGSSIPGGGTEQTKVAGVSEDQLLSAAKADANGATGALSTGGIAHGCPKFVPKERHRHITIYEDGRIGDGLAVKHRGEITKTARECIVQPGRVTVKYGFSGRVLLGPRGQTGPATFPVKVFVTDSNRQEVVADTMQVAVDLNLDRPISYFSAVRIIAFDVAQGARPGEYKMHVGFEKQAPGGAS